MGAKTQKHDEGPSCDCLLQEEGLKVPSSHLKTEVSADSSCSSTKGLDLISFESIPVDRLIHQVRMVE